jgi:hypothetical protein
MGPPPSPDDPRDAAAALPSTPADAPFDEGVAADDASFDEGVAADDASFDEDAPSSQPVEGGDAEDPPVSRPASERFTWLPYAVLGALVLLGVASVLGTLLR